MNTHIHRSDDRRSAVVALDREAAIAAITATTQRFTALLRDGGDIERLAGGIDWTIAETAAHVITMFIGFRMAIAGESHETTPRRHVDRDFPTRLAASNTAAIATVHYAGARHLAELMTEQAQRFLEVVEKADPNMDCETPWYGPTRTRTVDCLTALALGELTMHGHDIATGTGRRWPISAELARLIVGTVCPEMMPLTVRPEAGRGASMTFEIRLRGNGPRYVVRIADGTAEVRASGGPVDCVISADPVIYLMVVYGRMPVSVALLCGGIVAWGRRPWLGLRFKGLFFNP